MDVALRTNNRSRYQDYDTEYEQRNEQDNNGNHAGDLQHGCIC